VNSGSSGHRSDRATTTAARDRVRLAAVVFAVLFAQVLLYPGIDTLVAALGVGDGLDASMWFLAAEFAAFVAFAGVWGAVSDATGTRTRLILLGALGGAVGYAVLAALPGRTSLPFAAVLGLRVAQGAATIGAFSLAMTMLMDLSGGHGRNMGAAGLAIGLGTALGAPVGGQLYELGPVVPLYAASGLLVVVAGLTLGLEDRVPTTRRRSLARLVAGLRHTPALAAPFAFGFIDRLTAGFFALVGTLYFRTVFDLSPGGTGLMLALFFAPFALLQYPMGILSDRVGRTVPILLGSALYGIGVVVVGHAPTLAVVGVAMVAVGVLGATMAPATMALVSDLAADTDRGTAMAGFNAVGSLGFLAGILLGGTVAGAAGYRTAFLAAGGLEVVLAVLAIPAFVRIQTSRP
jgi:MFS family permease